MTSKLSWQFKEGAFTRLVYPWSFRNILKQYYSQPKILTSKIQNPDFTKTVKKRRLKCQESLRPYYEKH